HGERKEVRGGALVAQAAAHRELQRHQERQHQIDAILVAAPPSGPPPPPAGTLSARNAPWRSPALRPVLRIMTWVTALGCIAGRTKYVRSQPSVSPATP